MKELNITDKESGQRLDKYLLKYMNTAPKSFIYKMLRKKNIKLNSKKAEGSEMLAKNDIVQIYMADTTIAEFMEERKTTLNKGKVYIVYEDNNILIADKGVGVLSQPTKVYSGDLADREDVIIDRILNYLTEKGEYVNNEFSTFTPALCNRLDRNTSGLVICGKNLQGTQWVNKALKEKKIDKYYIAIVAGVINNKIILNDKLVKDENTNQVKIVNTTEDGQTISTEIEPLKVIDDTYTLVRIKLITGKTHQIRAHLQSIDHPILGDNKYGDDDINNYVKSKYKSYHQLLHAYELIFNEEEGSCGYLFGKSFKAPLPKWVFKFNLGENDFIQ